MNTIVKSARFLVEDENGFVIADAETFDEAKTYGGTVIDTQAQAQENINSSCDYDEDDASYMDGLEDAVAGLKPADTKDKDYMRGYNAGKRYLKSSYSPSLLEDLVEQYTYDYNKENHEDIYNEIMNMYNDEDLANDVLAALEDNYDGDYEDDDFIGASYDRTEIISKLNEVEPDNYEVWSTKELIAQAKDLGINIDTSFENYIVKEIMSGNITEEGAVRIISTKLKCNAAYANKILSNWINEKKPQLIESGILDIGEDINKDFDIDGDIDSWFEDYVPGSGKSNTVGGEIIRAVQKILYRYNNDGDRIGIGYGKETVNPAARYLIEHLDMDINQDIADMLGGDSTINRSDSDYEEWLDKLKAEVEDALRNDNGNLFKQVNKDDMLSWQNEDDVDDSISEVTVEDSDGTEYVFSHQGDNWWRCDTIELYNAVFDKGDVIYEGADYFEEIDNEAEYGSFTYDGVEYDYEATEDPDEDGFYHSYEITDRRLEDPLADEGSEVSGDEIVSYMNMGYNVYAGGGYEPTELQLTS